MVATPGTARTVRRIRSIMLNHVRPFVILTAGGRLVVGIASGRLLDKMQGIAVIMGTTPLSASAFISHKGPPPASKTSPGQTDMGGGYVRQNPAATWNSLPPRRATTRR